MKATIKITMMLMAMIIGTLAASAQSANRGMSQRDQERKSSARVESKNPRGNSNPGHSKRSSQNIQSRSSSSKARIERGSSSSNSNARPASRSKAVKQDNRKSSTTTHHNPRSNYRLSEQSATKGKTFRDPRADGKSNARTSHRTVKPQTQKHTGVVVRGDNRKYGHSRHYYPTKRVKIHVHPKTYHNHYRVVYYPAHSDIIWTRKMHRHYIDIYPGHNWRYPVGYHLQTVSAFDAKFNIGEISRVYGRVYATWYNRDSDDLLLFFGGEYPYQQFTVIVPGKIARRYSWRPERYFLGQHIHATGLISSFEGKPEMIIGKRHQLDIY